MLGGMKRHEGDESRGETSRRRLRFGGRIFGARPDTELAALARAGDAAAFAELVERHRGRMVALCTRLLPPARAEEATQEALLRTWEALRAGQVIHQPGAWLRRAAFNQAVDALRTEAGHSEAPLETRNGTSQAAEQTVLEREETAATLASLRRLPARQRVALVETAIHGRSEREVASGLGVSEGAVRQLVFRGRQALRRGAGALLPLPGLRWLLASGGAPAPTAAKVAGGLAAVALTGTVALAPPAEPPPEAQWATAPAAPAVLVSGFPGARPPAQARRTSRARPASARPASRPVAASAVAAPPGERRAVPLAGARPDPARTRPARSRSTAPAAAPAPGNGSSPRPRARPRPAPAAAAPAAPAPAAPAPDPTPAAQAAPAETPTPAHPPPPSPAPEPTPATPAFEEDDGEEGDDGDG